MTNLRTLHAAVIKSRRHLRECPPSERTAARLELERAKHELRDAQRFGAERELLARVGELEAAN